MSPFKSEAQRRKMHADHPEMAARWEKETPPGKLPEHVPHEKPKPKKKPPPKRWAKR